MVISRKLKSLSRKTTTESSVYSNTGFSAPAVASTLLPTSEDLFQAFQAVSRSWLHLPCQPLGPPVEGPSVMSLERCSYLAGTIRGLVNLRAHNSLGGLLLERKEGSLPQIQTSDEAFQELFQTFCGHLLSSFWNREGIHAIPSQTCTPQSWPKGKTQAVVALLLSQCPVEIRFWVEKGTGL